MIEEVTTRIAIGTSLTGEETGRRSPAKRGRPAWATAAMVSNGAALATNGRPPRTEWANTRTPTPWVSNPAPVEPAATERLSTMDDPTDVHGLGAALINAARISEALNLAATDRGSPMFDLPTRPKSTSAQTRSTTDRTASGLPIRGRARVEPTPEPATMDGSTGGDVAVLTEVEPEPDETSDAAEPNAAEPTPETAAAKARRGRWRNRRR